MTKTMKSVRAVKPVKTMKTVDRRPNDRLDLDPYLVQETTWTRDDLLRLRGMPVGHHSHRRRPQRRAA